MLWNCTRQLQLGAQCLAWGLLNMKTVDAGYQTTNIWGRNRKRDPKRRTSLLTYMCFRTCASCNGCPCVLNLMLICNRSLLSKHLKQATDRLPVPPSPQPCVKQGVTGIEQVGNNKSIISVVAEKTIKGATRKYSHLDNHTNCWLCWDVQFKAISDN